MAYTQGQVSELIRNIHMYGLVAAAQRTGMSVATAKKYLKAGGRVVVQPSRQRMDQGAFTEVWASIEAKLQDNPKVRATELLGWLMKDYPGQFYQGQLRTLQRLIRDWLCLYGPEKEVFFEQLDGSVI